MEKGVVIGESLVWRHFFIDFFCFNILNLILIDVSFCIVNVVLASFKYICYLRVKFFCY